MHSKPARLATTPEMFIQQPQPHPSSNIVNFGPGANSIALNTAPNSARSECQLAGIGAPSTLPSWPAKISGRYFGFISTPNALVSQPSVGSRSLSVCFLTSSKASNDEL